MATGGDVLTMLCNGIEYAIWGDDYNSIDWFGKSPALTKAQFEAGFAQYDAWKAEQDVKSAADKAALLAKLGITADEAKLLLS
jgi:hypothetical protein